MEDQPALHHVVSCVRAPAVLLSAPDGQLTPQGAQGLLCGDVRLLSEIVLTVGGAAPEPVGHALVGVGGVDFAGVVRTAGDPLPDPTVRVHRRRRLGAGLLTEQVELVNDARVPLRTRVALTLAGDLAAVAAVKHGHGGGGRTAFSWGASPPAAPDELRLTSTPRPDVVDLGADRTVLAWDVDLPPRAATTLAVEVRTAPGAGHFVPPARDPLLGCAVASADADVTALAARSLADLRGLLMAEPEHPGDAFLAAGAPWYFTLFGRDSLWAARMLLPWGTDLAMGTLRTLARYQGSATDPATVEEPGRILHELRKGPAAVAEGHALPPVYYGTVDATALWVCLLHDAWRRGAEPAQVEALLPALERALRWLVELSAPTGFLCYRDVTGRGLANQGWKDSTDAVVHADGRIAEGPVALCEAQAYAVEAARGGAALLDAFGRPGGDAARVWADGLAARFRDAFWVEDDGGRFPALALDGAGRPVASASSNLGHLLGTGLLDAGEAAAVAARLARADLTSRYGLRTLSAAHPAFNPLGYHTGSVWPHDTAIAVLGLLREGFPAEAATLAQGVVASSRAYDHRLPELLGGLDDTPMAYPASCRPQAWSAAGPLACVAAALGMTVDAPAGTVDFAPDPAFQAWWPLTVRGLRAGGDAFDVTVGRDGDARVAPPWS